MNSPIPIIYFHSPVIIVPLSDPVVDIPDELHLDEGEMSVEEFDEILPKSWDWFDEFGAESASEDEWLREHGQ